VYSARVMNPISPSRTLPLRSFALVGVVLALLALVVDLNVYGPVTGWAATTFVVAPVEKSWGFHTEWRAYGPIELLTVTSVTHGGAFDRAGVQPGFAFAPRVCAFGGPFFGGQHSVLLGERVVHLRMLRKPGPPWEQSVIEVRR